MNRIDEYVNRYFEGTLSEAEELRLKAFLSSPEGQAPEYDEVRAVVGYYSVGRLLFRKDNIAYSRKGVRFASLLAKSAVAAACVGIFIALGVNLYNKENICVSYVGGLKITDKEVVMNDVDDILADLLSGGTDVDKLLKDFFENQ